MDRHLRCPYCFGGAREVSAGDAERFCDFRPDVDPLVYGFPVGHDRADEA